MTPQEQTTIPYNQFETRLLNVTDLAARQGVIREWYDLTDDTYKQEVSFERFEAIEIQQPLASLQAALEKQSKLPRPRSSQAKAKLCPKCGNRFAADIEANTCPIDGASLQIVSTKDSPNTPSLVQGNQTAP